MEGEGVLFGTRGWTGLTAVCVAALSAVAIAPSAWADDTVPAPLPPVVADVGTVEIPNVDIAAGDAGIPVSGTSSEAGSSLEASDITSIAADTVADIVDNQADKGQAETSATQADAGGGPSATVQTDPSNLNVSIRVESPGNDGAVTQANSAATGTPTGTAAAPANKPIPSSTPASQASSPATTSAPQSGTPATSVTDTAGPGWNWTWDCASPPAVDAPLVRDADGELITWNWTWIWNCGGKADDTVSSDAQYHPATGNDTANQYRPVNVNISIRISSPGDNGPVNQANVAISVPTPGSQVGVSAGVTSAQGEVQVDLQLSGSSESPTADSSIEADQVSVTAFQTGFALAFAGWPTTFGFSVSVDGHGSLLMMPCRRCAPTSSMARTWVPTGPCGELQRQLRRLRGSVRWDDDMLERCLDATLKLSPCRCLLPGTPTGASDASGAEIGGSSTSSSARAATAVRPRVEPRKRESEFPGRRVPIPIGVSGAALGPAGSGASSGGDLPLTLLIPFSVALLDLLRRVAVAKVVWPPGRSGGTFDPPG
jgi:hypothetical protein